MPQWGFHLTVFSEVKLYDTLKPMLVQRHYSFSPEISNIKKELIKRMLNKSEMLYKQYIIELEKYYMKKEFKND